VLGGGGGRSTVDDSATGRQGSGCAASIAGDRPTVGDTRGGGVGGCCRWRKLKKEAETEKDDRRWAEPVD
jgi:hypothetical protein